MPMTGCRVFWGMTGQRGGWKMVDLGSVSIGGYSISLNDV